MSIYISTLVTSLVLYLLTRATLMSPGKDETRICGYIRSEFIHWTLWRRLMRKEYFCSFTTPQAFWQSSAHDALSTLLTSIVLYSLTWATLISPGKDETGVCGYKYIYIYIYKRSEKNYNNSFATCVVVTTFLVIALFINLSVEHSFYYTT